MNRRVKLILLGSLVAALIIAAAVLLSHRKPAIFGHGGGRFGLEPTLSCAYYTKHPNAIQCPDEDPHRNSPGDDAGQHGCRSCPVGLPDRIIDIESQIEPPVFRPGATLACQQINRLVLDAKPADPSNHAYGPGEPYPEMIVCDRKPWDGFVRIDGEKISCAEIEPKDNRQP